MTKPIRIPSRAQKVARLLVWHPINTDPQDEDRWGPRFWYPTYDVIAIVLGWVAVLQGSPLLNRLFPPWLTDVAGLILIAASVTCLIGVVVPRLAAFELLGKLGIVFLLGAYAGTVAFVSPEPGENLFIVIILVMAVWLLGPRVTKLFVMLQKQRKARRTRRLIRKGA